MRVLVTGANGFIGNNLVESLVANNFEVYSVIRNKQIFSNVKAKVINKSIENITVVELNELKIDIILHFAWSNVSKVMLESHLTEELEIQKRFLENVLKSKVTKIIISGSCFEYGKINGELGVDVMPDPNTNYGIAKNKLRLWLEEKLHVSNHISVFWMRMFQGDGKGQHERSLWTQLLNSISNKDEFFNMSRGFQIRDFISINETIDFVFSAMNSKQLGFNLVNVCSGNPISVREFVEDVIKKRKSSLKLNLGYYPIPDYEPLAFWGTKSKIK